jgi:cyclopentanol dehydrogenase
MKMDRLTGKRAIITGAAGGQGRVACRMFVAEGAQVLAVDIDPQAANQIEAIAPQAVTYLVADLTTAEGVDAVASSARRKFAAVDVLYNNHGIVIAKPILEMSRDEWDVVQNVNLRSFFFLTQAIVPLMRNGGSIINISSGIGLFGRPTLGAYCASKAGLINLTRVMALEFAPLNIRANVIAPGVIDTPMPRKTLESLPNKEEAMEVLLSDQIFRRLGRPEEIVHMAIYLASDESSFTTGSVISIDGGMSAI